jgi:hypothetical protein
MSRGSSWFAAKAGRRDPAHGPIRETLEAMGYPKAGRR